MTMQESLMSFPQPNAILDSITEAEHPDGSKTLTVTGTLTLPAGLIIPQPAMLAFLGRHIANVGEMMTDDTVLAGRDGND